MDDENIKNQPTDLTILLPTYNESSSIEKMLDTIKTIIPTNICTEVLVVDDDSPDGTSNTVNSYIKKSDGVINFRIHTRKNKRGVASAIIDGIALGDGGETLQAPATVPATGNWVMGEDGGAGVSENGILSEEEIDAILDSQILDLSECMTELDDMLKTTS